MRRKEFLKASFNADEQRLEYQMSMGSRCLKALILSVAATMSDKYLNKLVRDLVALQTSRKQPAKTSPRPMKREAVCEIQTAAVPAKAYKLRRFFKRLYWWLNAKIEEAAFIAMTPEKHAADLPYIGLEEHNVR